VAATLNANIMSDDQKIQIAFEMMDKDGDGYIEEKELAEIIGEQEFD
jgi:Ca2+-binding EF-hand superfamily protein